MTDETVAARLRTALGALRDRPWLWLVGATWSAVGLLCAVAAVAAWNVAGGLVFDLLIDQSARRYRPFADGLAVRRALPRAGLTVALMLPVYLLARATVVTPGDALAGRATRGVTFGGAARGVLADWPGLARSAVRPGLRQVALWLPLALLSLAVYLSVGTAAEAVGYALELYEAVPSAVPILGLVAAGLVGWAGAAATLREYDAGERSGPGALWTAFAVTVGHPRRRLADALVVTGLTALPFVVAAVPVALSLLGAVERTSALVIAVSLFVLLATVTLSTVASYRALSVADADPERRHAAGRSADRHTGRSRSSASAPTGRVALAVVLVVSAGLVGAGVRFVDARPGTGAGASAPGPVPDDPDRAIERGVAALPEASWTADERWYDHRVYPGNDTADPWRQQATLRYAVDRPDGQVLVYGLIGSGDSTGPGTLVYRSATGIRVGVSEARVDTDDLDGVVRDTFAETVGGAALPRTTDRLFGSLNDPPAEVGTDWRVVTRDEGRVVYESTDAETVVAVSELLAARVSTEERETPVSVRVTLDATTGHLQRVEVVRRIADDDPGLKEDRFVRQYDDVGSTDVTVPADPGRPPGAVLLDALLY